MVCTGKSDGRKKDFMDIMDLIKTNKIVIHERCQTA